MDVWTFESIAKGRTMDELKVFFKHRENDKLLRAFVLMGMHYNPASDEYDEIYKFVEAEILERMK